MPSLNFGDVRVETSNLDKVLYPQTGTTKGQVIDYYVEIAPAMIPHMAGRPVTRKRWPNGVESTPFFEKNLAAHAPEWIERKAMHHRSRAIVYPVIETPAGLAWLGQQASLEVHVPQWRFVTTPEGVDEMGPATRLVFDLDPGDGVSLADCAEVAIAVRDMVAQIDLVAFAVTSGSKGIHVYVPLDRTLGPGGASTVAKQVAGNLETLYPDRVTSTMAKVARAGKVFLDWSQNNPAKTTIAPYSMRGRAEPTVAAPRTWAELERPDGLRQLRFEEVLERYRATGDMLADLDPADDKLAKYRSMRNATRTPEPVPKLPPRRSDGNAFVIHEHHARRLHWDVRLERDGVLACWAVPKGVPETTTENRLAVHTEDHPIEYLTFAATIPKGQYGGGVMTIWDTGTYETEKWRDDEVIIRLHGDKVEGRYALIQTGGKNWLMHRMKDQTDRNSTRATSTAPDPHLPRGLAPMLATSGDVSHLDAEHWAFEGKWDGYRLVAEIDHGEMRLRSRAGNDVTARYPQLSSLAADLADHRAVLDGEVVVFDGDGIANFGLLQTGGISPDAQFLAFDVLYLDGTSLLRKKFADRRRVLEVLDSITPSLQVPPLLDGDGQGALAVSLERGLEGVVAKRRDSVYLPGKRGQAWVKAKNWNTQEVVIGGWKRGQGGRRGRIGSLLVGIPDADGSLRYVGKVGTGFSAAALERLGEMLDPLRRDDSPFAGDIPAADRKDAVWVDPRHVGEVRFMDWTGPGRLRHPAWRGLREDKKASEVRRES